jgi:hypothetical protein
LTTAAAYAHLGAMPMVMITGQRGGFFSITLNRKRTALAAIVETEKWREQFCDRSVPARFHAAWLKPTYGERPRKAAIRTMSG